MKQEVWKDIRGYKDYYQVSNFGRIKSLSNCSKKNLSGYRKKDIIKKSQLSNKGYLRISLKRFPTSHSVKFCNIGRLVAETFIPNPNNLPQINHIDGNKSNNHIDNLEWCSGSYNIKHAFGLGLKVPVRGNKIHNAVIDELTAYKIKSFIKQNPLFKPTKIARHFKISRNIVRGIIERGNWGHIKVEPCNIEAKIKQWLGNK